MYVLLAAARQTVSDDMGEGALNDAEWRAGNDAHRRARQHQKGKQAFLFASACDFLPSVSVGRDEITLVLSRERERWRADRSR